jgi:hypothetical protein
MSNIELRAPVGTAFVVDGAGNFKPVDAAGNVTVDSSIRTGLENAGFTEMVPEAGALGWTTGFYGPPGETLTTNFLTVASTLYMHPLYIPQRVTLKSISCNVTTGQTGGKANMGIYSSRNARPYRRLFAAAEVTGLTGAAAGTGAFTDALVNPGWYWLAGVFGATSTMPSVAGISQALSSRINQLLGSASAVNALAIATTNLGTGLSGSFTYAALPDTPPTMSLRSSAATPAFAIEIA